MYMCLLHAFCPGKDRHSVTVTVWRCWEDGRPPTPPTRSCWRCCGLGSAHTLRRFLLEGGVPEMRTGREKSPFHRHRTRPPGVDDCGRGVVPTKPRRLLSDHRDEARRGGYSAL